MFESKSALRARIRDLEGQRDFYRHQAFGELTSHSPGTGTMYAALAIFLLIYGIVIGASLQHAFGL